MITPEELDYIRTAAIGDMLGDSKALDEMGPAATVFRLCRELELSRKHAVTMSEVAAAAWGGETPCPARWSGRTSVQRCPGGTGSRVNMASASHGSSMTLVK